MTNGNARVQRTFDQAAADYDEVIDFFGPFGRALVAAAEVHRGDRVLDIASGRGACLRPALEAVGPDGSVLGIDLAPAMVACLSSELQAAGRFNAAVQQGDAEQLDLPDDQFDVVTGGFMIFFPSRPERVLLELHRVLKPGGRLALSIFDGPAGFPFQLDLLAEVGAAQQGSGPSTEFNKAAVLDPALVSAGFELPEAIDVIERPIFAGVEHVEAWQRTTGMREVFERFDAEVLARYRVLLAERLEPFRVDGGYELTQRVRLTVATKP